MADLKRFLLQVDDNQDLSDPMILKNLDVKCVKSLNGCRVTDEILRQVARTHVRKLTHARAKAYVRTHAGSRTHAR